MQSDDDKAKSFERLDETKVERNGRSFFDWITGKEDSEKSEEESLRKKLDKELKEAARKRAEHFEEERRVEEQREVAETRKLKKRWRAKLVEKSKAQLDEAESEASPADGYTIAKLMVAERIIKLSDMLENEDLRRSEIKALKIHIDFMGLLSEKLSRPEIEVPEEVEQLYQTIAASVEETVEAESGNKFIVPEEKTTEAPPESEEEQSYRVFAAGIVTAIRRAVRRAPAAPTLDAEPSVDGDTSFTPTERLPYAEKVPEAPEAPEVPVKDSPDRLQASLETIVPLSVLKIIREETQPAKAIREEIRHHHAIRRLAEIVDQAENLSQKEDAAVPTTQPTVSSRPTKSKMMVAEQTLETPLQPQKVIKQESLPPAEPPETKGTRLSDFPEADLETWSEADLVRKAWSVHLGDGHYLADAYQRGLLDKEGLIKVLKSHQKGRDYITEYSRRKRSEALNSSPERLVIPEEPANDTTDEVKPDNQKHELTAEQSRGSESETELTTRRDAIRTAQNIAHGLQKTFKKQANIYLLIASILTVLIVLAIVAALLDTR